MRKLGGLLAAVALVFGATAASAAPVGGIATLSVSIERLPSITLSSSGSWDVSGSTVTLGAGLVNLATPITIPVTGSTAFQSVQAVGIQNQTGTFSLGGITAQLPGEVCASAAPGAACNAGGGLGGAMGLGGVVNLIIVPAVTIPVDLDDAGIGQGGLVTDPLLLFDNAGWTTGRAFVRTDNATVGSLQATTTGASGHPITLVTTTHLNALGNLLPVTTTLTLAVPEPGTLLRLASGLAGLALVGRSRRK